MFHEIGRFITALKPRFVFLENAAPALASKTVEKIKLETDALISKAEELKKSLNKYLVNYDDIRFLADYSSIQNDKYETIEKSAQTEKAFVLRGYMPEDVCDVPLVLVIPGKQLFCQRSKQLLHLLGG